MSDSDGQHQIITCSLLCGHILPEDISAASASQDGGRKRDASYHLISAHVLLLASCLHCSVSSDYWHYGKFAADNQPQFPAKFLIMPAELPLGFSVCINRV